MYVKKSFSVTAVYHMLIGSVVAMGSPIIMVQRGDILYLFIALVGCLIAFAGYRLKSRATHGWTQFLIAVNLLQSISLTYGSFKYSFITGPTVDITIAPFDLWFGINFDFAVYLGSGLYWPFSMTIHLLQLLIAGYLLDQVRFVPQSPVPASRHDDVLDR